MGKSIYLVQYYANNQLIRGILRDAVKPKFVGEVVNLLCLKANPSVIKTAEKKPSSKVLGIILILVAVFSLIWGIFWLVQMFETIESLSNHM